MSNPALRQCLARFVAGERPSPAETAAAFAAVMEGEAAEAELGGWLTALAMAGETVEDVTAGAQALRQRMRPAVFAGPLMDVCGTGGDGAQTLNISTAVSLVLAGAGVRVAKHGNRAMSSRSGAADVLTALGVGIEPGPEALARAMEEANVAFLFAQAHHPAIRHAAGARKALGFRTVFNLLGPLANPAGAQRQLLGVYHARALPLMAQAAQRLGAEKVWVVHGAGGLDEIAPCGESQGMEATPEGLRPFTLSPASAGLPEHPLAAIRGGDPQQNAQALRALLAGAPGAYRDCVLLNAAAAFVVAGRASDMPEGAALARESLDTGAAAQALTRLIAATGAAP